MIRTVLRRLEIMARLKPRSQSGGRPVVDHRSFTCLGHIALVPEDLGDERRCRHRRQHAQIRMGRLSSVFRMFRSKSASFRNRRIRPKPRFKMWKIIPPGAIRAVRGIAVVYPELPASSISRPVPFNCPYLTMWPLLLATLQARRQLLDPLASAEVIAQKLRQTGFVISRRSVARVIGDYGLQKKTLSMSPSS